MMMGKLKKIIALTLASVLLYLPTEVSFGRKHTVHHYVSHSKHKQHVPTPQAVPVRFPENVSSDYLAQFTSQQLDYYYQLRHKNKRDGFNGCVLVAKDGKV